VRFDKCARWCAKRALLIASGAREESRRTAAESSTLLDGTPFSISVAPGSTRSTLVSMLARLDKRGLFASDYHDWDKMAPLHGDDNRNRGRISRVVMKRTLIVKREDKSRDKLSLSLFLSLSSKSSPSASVPRQSRSRQSCSVAPSVPQHP